MIGHANFHAHTHKRVPPPVEVPDAQPDDMALVPAEAPPPPAVWLATGNKQGKVREGRGKGSAAI